MKLLRFEYEIIYQPGKENNVVDALSRREGSSLLEVDHGDDETVSRVPQLILEGKDVLEGRESHNPQEICPGPHLGTTHGGSGQSHG